MGGCTPEVNLNSVEKKYNKKEFEKLFREDVIISDIFLSDFVK